MKKNKKQKDDFRKELDAYQAQGIPLWLDGEPSSPKEIWKAHKIAEDISYMRDYVPDSYGRLLRLEFDAVKKEDIHAKFEDGVLHIELPSSKQTKALPENPNLIEIE